jgi:hypothetical protein
MISIAAIVIAIAFLGVLTFHAFNAADTDTLRFDKGLPPDHDGNFKKRLAYGAIVYVLACVAWAVARLTMHVDSMLGVLALIPMGLGWWDASFRLLLNLMRERPWWYLGPSRRTKHESAIDTRFWKAAYGHWSIEESDRPVLVFSATGKRAGALAYGFDALLWIIGAIALVLLSRADAMPG